MSIVLSRIQEYYEQKGMSSREFSLSIGRSAAYFSNSLKKGSSPTSDLLSNICETYPDLNINWVLTGKGKMRISSEDSTEKEGMFAGQVSIDELVDQKIEEKFKDIKDVLAELVANEIEKEIEQTKIEMKKAPKP